MKECVICGELFEPIRKTQICCCKVCAEDRRILICRWNRKVRQAQAKRAKAEKAKEKPVIDEKDIKEAEYLGIPYTQYKRLSSLSKTNLKARKLGLSYGQYMAMEQLKNAEYFTKRPRVPVV